MAGAGGGNVPRTLEWAALAGHSLQNILECEPWESGQGNIGDMVFYGFWYTRQYSCRMGIKKGFDCAYSTLSLLQLC